MAPWLPKPLKRLTSQLSSLLTDHWPTSWKAVIPNALTLFRLVIAPLVFLCLWSQHPFLTWATLILFTLAAVTDYLDGFLSRLWRTESWLGRVLDPIADKLLVASVLVGLIAFRPTSFWITLVVYILLMRELLVSGLREAARGDDNLAVSMLGKAKTALQLVALFVLLAENAAGWSLNIGFYILAVSMILSLVSLVQYLIRFFSAPPSASPAPGKAAVETGKATGDDAT